MAAFTWISIRQVGTEQAITREGQITDRYNTAVSNLGNSSADVRIGSIYALQRIMRDSPADQPAVVSVLSAYIRTHAPRPHKLPPADSNTEWGTRFLDADDAAALTVLLSRNPQDDAGTRVDLHDTDLSGITLAKADLGNADLRNADLANARLEDVDLQGANLEKTDLQGSELDGDLRHADLNGANLKYCSLSANLSGANLLNVSLRGADPAGSKFGGTWVRLDSANEVEGGVAGLLKSGARVAIVPFSLH